MSDFTPSFVETGSEKVEGLTKEQIQYFLDNSEKYKETFENVKKLCEEALESHRELMEKWDDIFD